MDENTSEAITRILSSDTDTEAARREILPLIYDELKAIAQQRMRGERVGHTLGATALVSEAWVRLSGHKNLEFGNSGPFFAAASEAMRRILVDHARRKNSQKRGGDRGGAASLTVAEDLAKDDPARLLAVHEALDRLEAEEPRAAQIVRLRFFGGLDVEECAAAMEVSQRTLHREWAYAKARLFELLSDDDK